MHSLLVSLIHLLKNQLPLFWSSSIRKQNVIHSFFYLVPYFTHVLGHSHCNKPCISCKPVRGKMKKCFRYLVMNVMKTDKSGIKKMYACSRTLPQLTEKVFVVGAVELHCHLKKTIKPSISNNLTFSTFHISVLLLICLMFSMMSTSSNIKLTKLWVEPSSCAYHI